MSEQAFLVQLALLERDGELAAVDELIEAVPAGGQLVAIEGPPGIGKTALMIETKRLGQAVGLRASSRGPHGVALFEEAVDLLGESPAKLEHAKARTELGAALRRANRRVAARDHLRRAVELATICGAASLAARAERELLATGARPRRVALSGVDSLTPSERRVAEMAAEGRTNREMAQALFVTQRTVEVHLTSIYRKLEINSRSQLAAALGEPAGV
jgi:DNA-binding CsgD family transcriptional regulator